MSRKIVFGEIDPFYEGYHFEGRKEMMPSSFHRNWGAGIDGNGNDNSSNSQSGTHVSSLTARSGSVGTYLSNRRSPRNNSQSE